MLEQITRSIMDVEMIFFSYNVAPPNPFDVCFWLKPVAFEKRWLLSFSILGLEKMLMHFPWKNSFFGHIYWNYENLDLKISPKLYMLYKYLPVCIIWYYFQPFWTCFNDRNNFFTLWHNSGTITVELDVSFTKMFLEPEGIIQYTTTT